MSYNEDEWKPCPLSWGDRIDHPKFGFGKIVSEPVAMSGPIKDPYYPGGFRVGPKGWAMEIEWEDESRGTSSMGSEYLTLVERPDAKGRHFWANEYQNLLMKAQEDRSRTHEVMQRAFRDIHEDRSDAAKLREMLIQEKASLEALLEFLDADEAGDHA